MKKLIIVITSIAVLLTISLGHSTARTSFLMKRIQIVNYSGRQAIIWDQNQEQQLRLLYPFISEASTCAVFSYQDMRFCVKYLRIYQTGINVAYLDEGGRGTKQIMFFQDESGKYWGPYGTKKFIYRW